MLLYDVDFYSEPHTLLLVSLLATWTRKLIC